MLFLYVLLTNIVTIFLTYYIEKTLLLKFYAFLLHCSIAYYWQMNRDKNNKLAFEKFKTVYSDDCSVRIPASILNDCDDQYKFINLLNKYDTGAKLRRYMGTNVEDIALPKCGKNLYVDKREKLMLHMIKFFESSDLYKQMKTSIKSDFFEKYKKEGDQIKKMFRSKFKNIYNIKNVGSYYLSIDLKKGNFTAWFLFFSRLFEIDVFPTTWQDFMKQFDGHEDFLNSKLFRQNFFGLIGQKDEIKKEIMEQTRTLMRYIISNVANHFKDFEDLDFVCLSEDEVVFKIKPPDFKYDVEIKRANDVLEKADKCLSDFGRFHIDIFKLVEAKPGFIKEYIGENKKIIKIEIKNVASDKKEQVFLDYCKKNS